MIGLLPQPPSTDFSFVNTKVEPNIEHAFQALALDEHRRSYAPTIWEKPEGQRWPKILKQCWFPGVHSDIGGSYPDTDLANLTLCWMVSQLDPFIEFEKDYIWKQMRLSIERHEREIEQIKASGSTQPIPKLRPWGLGKIHNSMSFFFRLGGSKVRTPGEYCQPIRASKDGTLKYIIKRSAYHLTLHFGGKEKEMPRLLGTNETIHSSVRIRMGKQGLGYDDTGFYDSQALKGWTLIGEDSLPYTPHQLGMPGEAGAMKNVRWRKTVQTINPKTGKEETQEIFMAEDTMGAFEKTVLQLWPEIEQEFDRMRPGHHRQSIAHANTMPERNTSGKVKLSAQDKRGSRGSSKNPRPASKGTVGSDEEKLTLDTGGMVNGHVHVEGSELVTSPRRPDRVETI
jgi:hypothetical protein